MHTIISLLFCNSGETFVFYLLRFEMSHRKDKTFILYLSQTHENMYLIGLQTILNPQIKGSV